MPEHQAINQFGTAVESRTKWLIKWMMLLTPRDRPTAEAVRQELLKQGNQNTESENVVINYHHLLSMM